MKKTFFFICSIIVFLCFPNLVFNAVSDPPVNGVEPFIYYNMPESAFGGGNFKVVNFSFFKDMFQNRFYKDCNYKRYSYSNWANGNSYVTIDKTWNDSGFWKIDINLDVPVDLYEVNISFGCDLPVLNYVERDGYEIWLNYSINNSDEIYQVYFNWSDIADISGLTIDKHYDDVSKIWWVSLHRNHILSGFYTFDPYFGYQGEGGASYLNLESDIGGCNYTISEDGTADSISAFIYVSTNPKDVKGGIYFHSNKTFIAETECKELSATGTYEWAIFNFSAPKPELKNNINYDVMVWGESGVGSNRLKTENVIGGTQICYSDPQAFACVNAFPNPYDQTQENLRNASIYVSYTISAPSNNNPTLSGEAPVNSSTNIATTPPLYVICTDADSDTMNVTWHYNDSFDWWQFAENTSVSSGTNITQTNSNFSNNSQTYYWSVNCSDGESGWVNETYHFTTVAPSATITVSDEFPSNNSNTAPTQPYLYVTVNHSTGETMNISWYYGASEGAENTLIETDVNISNSTQNALFLESSNYNTEYFWRGMVWDGEGLWINETFIFNTTGTSGTGRTTSLWIIGVLFGIFGIISLFITKRRKEMKKIKKPKNHSGDEYYGSGY